VLDSSRTGRWTRVRRAGDGPAADRATADGSGSQPVEVEAR
jgi:hypothetical protein